MNVPSRTVLIVEDSPVQALALQQLLEDKGLQVFQAAEALAGLALAEKYIPDVIILDIELPVMNGIETCRRLKANPITQDIPVVILTAHGKSQLARQGLELGVADFIPKDAFSDRVLLETLRQLSILI
jgi:CheY-like chemotaxis protein